VTVTGMPGGGKKRGKEDGDDGRGVAELRILAVASLRGQRFSCMRVRTNGRIADAELLRAMRGAVHTSIDNNQP